MRLFLAAIFSIIITNAFSQFTSMADGNWNDGATWGNSSPGTVGVDFPGVGDNATIATSQHVVIPNGYDAQANDVTITNSSNTDLTISNGGSLSFTGIVTLGTGPISRGRLFVDGRLTVEEGATIVNTSTPGRISVGSTGIYQHNYTTTAGVIYNASWASGSTLEITGYTSNTTIPSGLSQGFSNFTWDCPLQENDFYLNGTEFTTIAGNFSVLSTAGGFIFGLTLNNNVNLTIGGNLVLGANVYFDLSGGSANTTVNLGGDMTISSDDALGNFGSGTCEVIFDNQVTPQTISNQSQLFSPVDFSVAAGATLVIGQSDFVSSLGGFTLDGSVVLRSTNPSGAILGNIKTSTRAFSSGSTIEYNGSSSQFMGTGHPSGSNIDAVINNATGVSLAANVTIGGNLTLTAGNLSVGSKTLTLGGNVTPNSHFILVISSSSLVINGSGAFGTFPFSSGVKTFKNFTLNRVGGSVKFANDVTITGTLTFTSGNLNFNATTLRIPGSFVNTGGLFASTSSVSRLVLTGTGSFGTLAFDPTANTIGWLTMNRASGSASLNSNLFVMKQLDLTNGNFTNTSGLIIGNNATVTRSSNGQLLGSALANSAGEKYSVDYSGGVAYNTGLELPTTTANDLLNLTINAPVTLDKNIIVNGNITLQNSTLSGSFNITMAGTPGTWTTLNGSFNPGTGSVIITGNISVASTSNIPQFGNLITNSGSTLTMFSGTTNISGNFQLSVGSTFNANGGTIEFNGGSLQGVAGASKNFNNITVNKSGGNLQLTSNVNLNGVLDVSTATTVLADGNLTVVSTSDGTSGNGSIGPLATGASISGNVTVQRYMSEEGRIYRYISSSVTAATVAQLQDDFPITGSFTGASTCSGCSTNSSMFYYNESTPGGLQQGYFQYPVSSNTEILTPGVGYVPFVRDDIIPGPVTIDVTGTVNQGTVSLPMTYTNNGDATADGYNLVGNPFPATIGWDVVAGWSKTNIALPIAVRDNGSGGTFLYWDGSGGGLPSGYIAAGQGFWVRGSGSGASLSVNENAKVSATGAFFRNETVTPDIFQLALTKGGITDRAYFRFRKEAKGVLDDYDAPKLDNALFDIATLSKDKIPMAINATNEMPCGSQVNVFLKDMEAGSYSLTTETSGAFTGFKAFLRDNFTNTTVDFSTTPQYDFEVTGDPLSSASDRFFVTFDEPAIDPGVVKAALQPADCETDQYKVTLEDTQDGIYYFAELGGQAVGDSVLSTGSDPITLSIPSSSLAVGTNQIVVKGFNYCSTVGMNDMISVDHDELYAVTSKDVTGCQTGEVMLEASGSPENGSYNWYEEEGSATPVDGQHESTFITPSLAKSKTYYVASVNAVGCEGPRVAVKANVVNYDPVEITEPNPGEFTSSYTDGNQWYLDGEMIEGATGQTLTPTESGTYSVDVKVGSCTTSAARQYEVTGIDEFDSHRMLNVYANPFVDILRVRVSSPKVEQMSIFDNLGAKIGDMTLSRELSETEGMIDMSTSASGMYFVKALLDGKIYTVKVIKK
jgi:Ig-like domain CHU_C associated/Secretion system C-terminal sorting domain